MVCVRRNHQLRTRYELPVERFLLAADLALGSILVERYALSFATVAYFYDLTSQASATVFFETTKGKGNYGMEQEISGVLIVWTL